MVHSSCISVFRWYICSYVHLHCWQYLLSCAGLDGKASLHTQVQDPRGKGSACKCVCVCVCVCVTEGYVLFLQVNWKRYKKALLLCGINITVVSFSFNMVSYPLMVLRGNPCGYTLPSFAMTLWHLFCFIVVEEIGFYYTHRCGRSC